MLIAAVELFVFVLLVTLLWLWRKPGEAFGLPLLAVAVFAFLYLGQPAALLLDGSLESYVTAGQAAKGLLIAALAMGSFVLGWSRGRAGSLRQEADSAWDPQRACRAGLGIAVAGLVLRLVFVYRSGGFLAFYSLPHGGAGAWSANTAYLYHGLYWVLSGTALVIIASSRTALNALQRTAIILLVAFVLTDAVLGSSRGMFYSTASTVLVALCLAQRVRPSVTRALGVMAAGGLAILLLVGYRSVLHLGEFRKEAPSAAEALTTALTISPTQRALRMSGTEFVYHALAIDTVDETGKLHLGLQWLYKITVHAIPRILWPDKPYGFPSGGIVWADIEAQTGVRIAPGSAPGIVADIYTQFGRYFFLFFYVFGWSARRLMDRAQTLSSPLASVAYTMLYALGLHTFAQDFGALIVPFLYSLAPVIAYSLLNRYGRRPAIQRVEAGQAVLEPQPGWSGVAQRS